MIKMIAVIVLACHHPLEVFIFIHQMTDSTIKRTRYSLIIVNGEKDCSPLFANLREFRIYFQLSRILLIVAMIMMGL